MTRSEDADRRIEALERELARIQHEQTTPLQIAAHLCQQKLGATLLTVSLIAQAALGIIDRASGD